MTLEFLVLSLLIIVSPGPGALLSLAAGLNHGARASIVTAFGCTLGILPHILAAMTGVAAFLKANETVFSVIKYFGVAYLLWMAWKVLKDKSAFEIADTAPLKNDWDMISSAILLNLLNPKLSMFFLAFLPQFISNSEQYPLYLMSKLSLIFMLMTFIVFAIYGLFAVSIRGYVSIYPAILSWLQYAFAIGFFMLGAKLLITGPS